MVLSLIKDLLDRPLSNHLGRTTNV